MKLYTTTNAPSPARVQFFMAEKGIEIPRQQVNLMKGEHRTPEYRRIAINSRVPALELDDGTTLCESMTICRYLEDLHPSPDLFGTTPLERARIDMWIRVIEGTLMLPMANVFRHTHPALKALEDQVPEFGEKQRGVVQKRLLLLEKQIAGRDYLAGDRFTMADIAGWVALTYFSKGARIPIPEECAGVNAWLRRAGERPAAKFAFA